MPGENLVPIPNLDAKLSNGDPLFLPELATRSEWQANVRVRFPFAEPDNPVQEPYTITTYPDAETGLEALRVAVDKTRPEAPSPQAALNSMPSEDPAETLSFAELSMVLQLNKEYPNAVSNSEVRAAINGLLRTSAWRREQVKKDQLASTNTHLEKALDSIQRNAIATGIRSGIERGYLPEKAWDRYVTSLEQTTVRTVSPAISQVETDFGHYDSLRDEIVVHDSAVVNNETNPVGTLGHEYGHKNAGGTFRKATDGNLYRTRVGFVNDYQPTTLPEEMKPAKEPSKLGWDEATNEHKNLGILSGDFETVDPDERPEKNSAYPMYRKVLADAYKKSRGLMQVKTLTQAHEEDTGPEGGFSKRRAFVREVVATYGWGSIRKIEKLMQCADQKPHKLTYILECIHPPETDAHGNITKKGWIDEYKDEDSKLIDARLRNDEFAKNLLGTYPPDFSDWIKEAEDTEKLAATKTNFRDNA